MWKTPSPKDPTQKGKLPRGQHNIQAGNNSNKVWFVCGCCIKNTREGDVWYSFIQNAGILVKVLVLNSVQRLND